MNRQKLKQKVMDTVDLLIREKGYVSPIDLFMHMDRLTKQDMEAWRFKRVPYLERVINGNLGNISFIMKELQKYAHERKLRASFTDYRSWGKGRKIKLTFRKSGSEALEKAYATHYVSPQLESAVPVTTRKIFFYSSNQS